MWLVRIRGSQSTTNPNKIHTTVQTTKETIGFTLALKQSDSSVFPQQNAGANTLVGYNHGSNILDKILDGLIGGYLIILYSAPAAFVLNDGYFVPETSLQVPKSLPPEKSRPLPSSREKPPILGDMTAMRVEQINGMNGLGFVTSDANLRSGAGVNSTVILTLPKGTEVQVRGKVEERNWYLVNLTSKRDPEKIN
jgi:hypothetical protein